MRNSQESANPISEDRECELKEQLMATTAAEVFKSEAFVTKYSKTHYDTLKHAVGDVLNFLVIHPEGGDKEKLLAGELKLDRMSAVLVAIEKLKLTTPLSYEDQSKLYQYFFTEYGERNYVFHGFNGNQLESIKEHGLDPDKHVEDWSEIREIAEMGKRYGDARFLGWAGINSIGRISYDGTATRTYNYASVSPEWFAHLCGYGMSFSEKEIDIQAYIKKDYDACRKNVEILVERFKFNESDRIRVLSFFEKHWSIFGKDACPQVALIRRKAVDSRPILPPTLELYLERNGAVASQDPKEYLEYFKDVLRSTSYEIDRYTENKVASSEMVIIPLPHYKRE